MRTSTNSWRLLALATVLLAGAASADDTEAQARARFAEAVQRYARGDLEGALAGFLRVYETAPRASVLFNIGLVYAELRQPVKALDALDAVLAKPGTLGEARLAKARAVRDEQAARVGTVRIDVPVVGAKVDVNRVEVGAAPLPAPVRIAAGRAVVSAIAPRYAPRNVEVDVPPGGQVDVTLDLAPLERTPAQLKVTTPVPDAAVYVDGVLVGTTPLAATIPVTPGDKTVRVARDGYLGLEKHLALGEGAFGELAFDLEEDRAATAQAGALLRLLPSETEPTVTVNGVRRGVYAGPLVLPPGRHVLLVERGGFYPERREVTLLPSSELSLDVLFEPTPELRADLETRRAWHRNLGIAGLSLGGLGLAGGAGYLVYNKTAVAEIERQYIAARDRRANDPACTTGQDKTCDAAVDDALIRLQAGQNREVIGWVLLGAGAVVTAGGLAALFTGPDLDKYRPRPAGDLAPELTLDVGLGPDRVVVSGRF